MALPLTSKLHCVLYHFAWLASRPGSTTGKTLCQQARYIIRYLFLSYLRTKNTSLGKAAMPHLRHDSLKSRLLIFQMRLVLLKIGFLLPSGWFAAQIAEDGGGDRRVNPPQHPVVFADRTHVLCPPCPLPCRHPSNHTRRAAHVYSPPASVIASLVSEGAVEALLMNLLT